VIVISNKDKDELKQEEDKMVPNKLIRNDIHSIKDVHLSMGNEPMII
jgi:hypothetical protein